MRQFLICIMAVSALAGCKTRIVTVPEYHVRDSVVVRLQRDSVYSGDSVYVGTFMRGDTVFVEKVKTKFLYKDRLRTDTVAVSRRDSVPYVVERNTTEYKWRVRWYDKACRLLAAVAALVAAARFLSWYARERLGK